MRGDIARSVLDKAVKHDVSATHAAESINELFDILEWSNDCPYTAEELIDLAKFQVCGNSVDKDAYNNWINKYQ